MSNPGLRICQNCLNPELPDAPLRSCAGCKRSHYCDKACQRADWPNHKPRCAHIRDLKARLSAAEPPEGTQSNALLRELSTLKTWTRNHGSSLAWAAIHALHLSSDPSNCEKFILNIQLVPSGAPAPRNFLIAFAEVTPVSTIKETLTNAGKTAALEMLTDTLQRTRRSYEASRNRAALVAIWGPIASSMTPFQITNEEIQKWGSRGELNWLGSLRLAVEIGL